MREMEVLLSVLGEKDGIGIDQLVSALGSTEPGVRRIAFGVLVRYRAAECFDDDGLIDLLDHGDEEVRSYAALAFSWSRRLRVPAREEVARALMVGGPAALRRASCRGAKELGPAARDSVPMLVSLVEARPWAGQATAAEALGAMGPAAAAAVPALLGATQAADPELVAAALDALCRISPGEGIPAASRALEHENGGVRDAALTALWGLGSDSVPALHALRKTASGDDDPAIAARAGRLVQLIDARSGRSTPEAR
jgi:HEAT repeat protein